MSALPRDFCGFVGVSPPMRQVYATIEKAALSRATVFITGESGTGKELCAQALHRQGPRRSKPFLAINCAAIPRELMESEIFGHVRGAFTGAVAERAGAAALADGGTLFLDEIAEMDAPLQAKFLRFLQTGTYQKIGSNRVETADIRMICATNRDPQDEVRQGRLRQDLYYRLHVIPIHMPPLRARGADVLSLAENFLHIYAEEEGKVFEGFDASAKAALCAHVWPGNVRELQNTIRCAVVMNAGGLMSAAMLGLNGAVPEVFAVADNIAAFPRPAPAAAALAGRGLALEARPLWRIEKDAIEDAIARCGGNIPRAAAVLEVSPSTIYRKKQAWESADADAVLE